MNNDKEDIEKEIEEKNKILLEEININEKAMGYRINRERKYQEISDKDREQIEINNVEGD